MTEWAQGLAGLTGEQVKRGLETWTGNWPPSLPEFRAACEPSLADLGLPDARAAWVIVCNATRQASLRDRWQHPIVMEAARDPRLDLHNLRLLPIEQAVRVWAPVYAEYVERAAQGESFAWPEERAIEDRRRKPVTPNEKQASRAYGRAQLRALQAGLRRRFRPANQWQQVHGMVAYV